MSLAIQPGEIVGMLGENGAGKSTLMKIVYGLLRPDAGSVSVDGQEIALASPRQAMAAGIGMVTQEFSLVETMSVTENVVLSSVGMGRVDRAGAREKVGAAMERIGVHLDPDLPISRLSIGERQRVEIVKALFHDCRVMILDEPTAVLTPQDVDALFRSIRRLREDGMGVLLVSHKLKEVAEICDRVLVLRRGRLVADRPMAGVDHGRLAQLMMGLHTDDDAVVEETETAAAVGMVEQAAPLEPVTEPTGPVMLSVRDLRVEEDGRQRVDGVDLEVRAGEVLGLAGISGNGQTELVQALAGVRPVSAGTITVDGTDLTGAPVADRLAAGLGRLSEDRKGSVVPQLSVEQNLVLEDLARYTRNGLLDRKAMRAHAEAMIERFEIKAKPTTPGRVAVGRQHAEGAAGAHPAPAAARAGRRPADPRPGHRVVPVRAPADRGAARLRRRRPAGVGGPGRAAGAVQPDRGAAARPRRRDGAGRRRHPGAAGPDDDRADGGRRMMRLVLRGSEPRWVAPAALALAVALTLALTGIPIRLAGANPPAAFERYLITPLSSTTGVLEVLLSATPLVFTGLAVALAFRVGYWNIGAEGQFLAGAVAVTWIGTSLTGLPAVVALPLGLVCGALGGVAWAVVPAWLRTTRGIDEVVTTLLLNPVALLLVQGLLNGPWRNSETGFTDSDRLGPGFNLPELWDGSRVHWGLVLALILVAVWWVIPSRTSLGLQLFAAGQSPRTAEFNGIRVRRLTMRTALVSGGIAGLGGAVQVMAVQHQLVAGISDNYGYTGVIVATLGGLSALGVLLVSLLLGDISVGAQNVSLVLQVPTQLGGVFGALLLLTVLSTMIWRRYRIVGGDPRDGAVPDHRCAGDRHAAGVGLARRAHHRAHRGAQPGHRGHDGARRVRRVRGGRALRVAVDGAAGRSRGSVAAGLLLGLLIVTLGLNQHVSGLGVTLLLIAGCEFASRVLYGGGAQARLEEKFGKVVTGVPVISQSWMTWVAFLVLAPLMWWILRNTGAGYRIHAVGESFEAADVAGISVNRVRYAALVVGSVLMAVGGSFITLAVLGSYTLDIINGRGWVCIALVIFAQWRVWPTVLGALLFALTDALQLRLAITETFAWVPRELMLALPYLVVIAALAVLGRAVRYPTSYLKPYRRG